MSLPVIRLAVLGFFVAALAACSSSSTTTMPTPVPGHLYVNNVAAHGVSVYAFPFTASSTALYTVSNGLVSPGDVAVDSAGDMAVCDGANPVRYYTAPLSSSSTVAATLATECSTAAFDANRALYVPTQGPAVNVYAQPITSAEVPTTITNGITDALSVAFDASGRLYVGDDGGTTGVHVYTPPYSGAPAFTVPCCPAGGVALRGIAVDASGDLFVAELFTSKIWVFTAPLSAASTSAFQLTGVTTPEDMVFDASGKLYVVDNNDGSLKIYMPPFSGTSMPTVVPQSATFNAAFGVAAGP
jgi:hypothetical protein